MNADIIDDQYERIKGDLVRRGLTYDRLLDDLLDHVCCMVEAEMNEGGDFETSYAAVLESIGDKRFSEIQHQTILYLDKNFQRMKKFTYLFGISSALITLIGALFKKMHWPGAGILIPVGMALVVLVFLPLYFRTSYREQPEKKNPVYALVGYLTLGLLLAGATFKNMHWPGANALVMGGAGFLVLGFVPLYVVNAFQRSGRENITLPYMVMLLVGIAIVVLFSNVNMRKELLNHYREDAIANELRVEKVQERTTHLLQQVHDSLSIHQVNRITHVHEMATGLQLRIKEMQDGMKAFVRQPGVPISELDWIDNKNAGREAIIEEGKGRDFMREARKYKKILDEMIEDPVTLSQIEDHLEFVGDIWYHEFPPGMVVESPLMKNYYKNSDASKGIALSEYVAISYLLRNK
jgi:hypothetical protein